MCPTFSTLPLSLTIRVCADCNVATADKLLSAALRPSPTTSMPLQRRHLRRDKQRPSANSVMKNVPPRSSDHLPASRLMWCTDILSTDLLALVARFLPNNDLLACTLLSSRHHRLFDSDRVWRPRLPPTTTPASPGSCKAQYVALHGCSEHAVRRCYRLLPPSRPIPGAPMWPVHLKLLLSRQLRVSQGRVVLPSPLPSIIPLPLCRSCLLSIADCARVRLAELFATTQYAASQLSCLVRLTSTEYDVRWSAYENTTVYCRLTMVAEPVSTTRRLLSRLLPGTVSAPVVRYRCTSSLFEPDGSPGRYAVHSESNVDWVNPCPQTAGRKQRQCEQHRAMGCGGALHHYERVPYKTYHGVCLACRVTCVRDVWHCSLCWFDLCAACSEQRSG